MSSLHAGLTMLSAATSPPSPPAGGFSEKDLGYAGAAAGFATIVLMMGGLGHRAGLVPVIGWFDRFAERISGQPGWSSMPCGLAIMSLITALFGLYWDVSLHVDVGRDEGPFGTPAHYFILAGLYGIVMAGFFAMCLPERKEGPTFVKITRDWHAPLGGILMFAAGSFSLLGFPLDDQWHRLFGQDVTLWGPTHLMLIGGAAMTLLAIAVLQVEAVRVMKRTGQIHSERRWVKHLRHVWLPGGMLIAMSTFQLEYDLGIPQFQLIFQPMLIMLAAGVVLVATRVWLGAWSTFGAVAFFLVMRTGLSLLVGDLGQTAAHFPLYIAEAALVEGVALLVSPRRPLVFGAWCGVLIGTVGLAAEWGWSHVWMPLPWPTEILPQVAAVGLAAALAGSLIGAWMGARLGADELPQAAGLRWAGLSGALAVAALISFGLYTPSQAGVSAQVTLRDVASGPERSAIVTARITPPRGADGATWLTATAWQGGGLVTNRMKQIGPDLYRSTEPIPMYGTWKALIRMHHGSALSGLPLYAPADPAIPAPAVVASRAFERPFVDDKALLQREAKVGDPAVTYGAYAVIVFFTVLLLAMLAWGLHRIRVTSSSWRSQTPAPDPYYDGPLLATPPTA
ncbi:MAG TPA: hypothetical protein VGO80_13050 [Solirubrobacteraceae bacterium]|jgi:hypothetical protein|nr:hypothetical protein [Solirubrobacteraceae bacterium]